MFGSVLLFSDYAEEETVTSLLFLSMLELSDMRHPLFSMGWDKNILSQAHFPKSDQILILFLFFLKGFLFMPSTFPYTLRI